MDLVWISSTAFGSNCFKTPETESNVTLKILWLKSQPGASRTGHAQAAARVGVTPRQGRVLPRPPRRTAPARREEQRQHYVLNVLTKAIPSRSIPRSSGNSTPLIAKLPPPHLPPPLPLSLSEPVAAWLVPRAAASGCGLVHL